MPYKDKEKEREYYSRPEVKARKKEYEQRPEVRERINARVKKYNSHPEYKQRRKECWKEWAENHKEERKEYMKEWGEKNKERIAKHRKEYYSRPEVKQREKESWKEWAENHKEERKEYMKEYQFENKEYLSRPEVKQKSKEYREKPENKERVAKLSKEHHKKRVMKENERRKKLGLALVGEGFRKEMELKVYIHHLFMDYDIFTHHRKTLGDWGQIGLELDIYIPELKLAFEYNGIQHYEFNSFFQKTEEDFKALQYRDRCKKRICKLKGITLIRIRYDEKLSEQLVLTKIKHFPFITNQDNLINIHSGFHPEI